MGPQEKPIIIEDKPKAEKKTIQIKFTMEPARCPPGRFVRTKVGRSNSGDSADPFGLRGSTIQSPVGLPMTYIRVILNKGAIYTRSFLLCSSGFRGSMSQPKRS